MKHGPRRKKASKLVSGDAIYFDSRIRIVSELFSVGHLDGKDGSWGTQEYIWIRFTNGGTVIVPEDREFELVSGPLHS